MPDLSLTSDTYPCEADSKHLQLALRPYHAARGAHRASVQFGQQRVVQRAEPGCAAPTDSRDAKCSCARSRSSSDNEAHSGKYPRRAHEAFGVSERNRQLQPPHRFRTILRAYWQKLHSFYAGGSSSTHSSPSIADLMKSGTLSFALFVASP